MKVINNASLSEYTSLRAGGMAAKLIDLDPEDSLAATVEQEAGNKIWILGYGTNCLISDRGLDGTIIVNRFGAIYQQDPTTFKVDSGCRWDTFILQLIAQNLWGLEFTSGIPGGTGAAVVGNIAAYGHKISDNFQQATMLDSETGQVEIWYKDKFDFSYRNSNLSKPENAKFVILDSTFKLSQEPTGELEYESALKVAREKGIEPDSLVNRRTVILATRERAGSLLNNQVQGPWTAGSFFKNPLVNEQQVEAIVSFDESGITREQLLRQNQIHGQAKARVSAAHVLLAAGFKRGQTWGQVRLHPDHILKIENIGGATAQEIYNVVHEILGTVKQKLNIDLEPEVRFIGEFENT